MIREHVLSALPDRSVNHELNGICIAENDTDFPDGSPLDELHYTTNSHGTPTQCYLVSKVQSFSTETIIQSGQQFSASFDEWVETVHRVPQEASHLVLPVAFRLVQCCESVSSSRLQIAFSWT